MDQTLLQLRTLIDQLEPELLVWQQTKSEDKRKHAHALATAAARQIQIILNTLRPPVVGWNR